MAPPADPKQRAVIDLTARFVAADGDAFERVSYVRPGVPHKCVVVGVWVGAH